MTKPKATPAALINHANRPPLRYFRMNELPIRPGALAILMKPSRVADTLFFPTGWKVKEAQE